ncbi:glycine N-acyltransferase-like protein 2 [Dicentrarchus labrax]|uniref:glycine N-acyltransferase-like protein 2 n=1 Tax=Dicentrarchus labrax TaxID=13489 RepID=UPI0021F5424F|nr:glycine N-acyltransferase-like protein 2 [Dicentrarchus labrax]
MIILKAVKDLTLMKNILRRDLPHSITVLGGVLHILHNNSCHLEMCVDSWPTFTTAICYRQKQHFGSSSGVIPDICTIFTKNPATLRGLLLNERVVHWRNGLIFRGIPSSHCHLIKELASLSGLDITEYGGYNTFIHQIPENTDWQENVFPLPISVLDESHAELVDAHLPYGGSQESLNHVRACIRHLPNHCVTDEKGRPVSWMLSDELCELRMAYTLTQYRRAGHLLALSLVLIRRMISVGLPVYCHVHQQNQATINAVTSLGFDACPSMENISVLLICKDRV